MPQFVVLLRGVNVGKANRVPMAEFRAALTSLGYSGVRTLLNSGNAVFDAPGRSSAVHARRIDVAMQEAFGWPIQIVVKSASEFAAAIAEAPAPPDASEHSRFFVAFAQDGGPIRDLAVLEELVRPPESFAIGPHAAYLHCPGGALESQAGKALLGRIGRSITSRNWATVLKIAALLGE